MKIKVVINIPPGDTCFYPPRDDSMMVGYSCQWKLSHMAAGKKWCRIFDEVDVTSGYKCAKCLETSRNQEVHP